MTDPKETNEDINEELSTDELKSASGGLMGQLQGVVHSFAGHIKSGAQNLKEHLITTRELIRYWSYR